MEKTLLDFAMTQGPWALIGILCLIGAWKGSKWAGVELALPVVKRHLVWLDELSKTLSTLSETMISIKNELTALRTDHEVHCSRCPNNDLVSKRSS